MSRMRNAPGFGSAPFTTVASTRRLAGSRKGPAGSGRPLPWPRSSGRRTAGADPHRAARAAAGRALLAAHAECDVILCDDGLQHYRLRRDFEIAVEDERGYGNGLPLPAGPLREPAGRRVDATVVNGVEARLGAFRMRLTPAGLYRVDAHASPLAQSELSGKKLHAVAGIGD